LAVKSILMVCRGNICRSPMAEGYFQHHIHQSQSDVYVSSAGITALIDQPADTHAIDIMNQYQIDISKHRARQITDEFVRKTDLILVMTESHLNHLLSKFSMAKGKTFLLGHFQDFEVEDPYMRSSYAFEKTYHQIHIAWQDWKSRIISCSKHN